MVRIVEAWLLGDGVKVPIKVEDVIDYLKRGEDIGVRLDSGHEAVVFSDRDVFVMPINIKNAKDIERVKKEIERLLAN